MKSIRVQYTVKPDFVERNKKNVEAVMADLRSSPVPGLRYTTFQLPDETTFMHLAVATGEEAMSELNARDSFKAFLKELRESEPVVPPKPEGLTFVASSFDLL